MIVFTDYALQFQAAWPIYRSISENIPKERQDIQLLYVLDCDARKEAINVFAASASPVRCTRPFKMVHVFHGLIDKKYTYELNHNVSFDHIFAPGRYGADSLVKNDIEPERITITGWPKLDRFFDAMNAGTLNGDHDKPNILYAPTASDDWRSSLKLVKPEWLTSSAWNLKCKLHPNSPASRDMRDRFERAGAEFIDSNSPCDMFRDIDLLISDSSSVILEFMFTGKPILVFDVYKFFEGANLLADIEYVIQDKSRSNFAISDCKAIETIPFDFAQGAIDEALSKGGYIEDARRICDLVIAPQHRDGKAGKRIADALLKMDGKYQAELEECRRLEAEANTVNAQ